MKSLLVFPGEQKKWELWQVLVPSSTSTQNWRVPLQLHQNLSNPSLLPCDCHGAELLKINSSAERNPCQATQRLGKTRCMFHYEAAAESVLSQLQSRSAAKARIPLKLQLQLSDQRSKVEVEPHISV